MALLVTGAMGHVGFELVRRSLARGLRVVAIYRGGFRADDAADCGPLVTWLPCALDDAEAVSRLASAHEIDACIHAAAVSNEAYAKPEPLRAIGTNVGATANLLDAARRHGWRRFVLVSTGSVFQLRADRVTPILEDAQVAPQNIYSTTKVAAEMLTRMYRTEYGLSASSVRISWVYGPPVVSESPTRGPIPSYLARALRGEPIREGGGDFAASFTYVTDAADGLIAAAVAETLRHPVYHLGHGSNFTAREAASAVRAAVPDAELELGGGTDPWTQFTALRAPLAGTRLAEDRGFAPRVSLKEGVAAYASWLRQNGGDRAGDERPPM